MLDEHRVDELRAILIDRFTAEELVELLGLTTGRVFDMFTDECMELNQEDLY